MSSVNAARSQKLNFAIERMTEHDLLEVVEIEEASGLSLWGWDGYYGELARGDDTVMLVARTCKTDDVLEHKHNIAGFIAARIGGGDLHINNIAVREIYRQMKIGTALLECAIKEGRRRGARCALLEVRAANITAQAFYERQGFIRTGSRKNYYAAPLDDALLMEAEIR